MFKVKFNKIIASTTEDNSLKANYFDGSEENVRLGNLMYNSGIVVIPRKDDVFYALHGLSDSLIIPIASQTTFAVVMEEVEEGDVYINANKLKINSEKDTTIEADNFLLNSTKDTSITADNLNITATKSIINGVVELGEEGGNLVLTTGDTLIVNIPALTVVGGGGGSTVATPVNVTIQTITTKTKAK